MRSGDLSDNPNFHPHIGPREKSKGPVGIESSNGLHTLATWPRGKSFVSCTVGLRLDSNVSQEDGCIFDNSTFLIIRHSP